jgi:ribosomal-protein-alanine acetyltransferase
LSAKSDMTPTDAPITIRPATVEDLPALLSIEERSFVTDRMSRRSFRHLLKAAHADCLVAADRDRLVGYAVVFYRRTIATARLHSLAVDPDSHGGGIGRALLSAVEGKARDRGNRKLHLEVRQDNPGAIRLYRASGYRDFRTQPNYYSDGMTALSMEKSLVVG